MSPDMLAARRLAPIAFSGGRLDRADPVRNDPEALSRLMQAEARLLRLDGLDPPMTAGGALAWSALAEAASESELVFLGLDGENACFVEVRAGRFADIVPKGPGASPVVWQAMETFDPADLAAYGTARALVAWHLRHKFCSVCGSPSRLAKGGWQRICEDPACAAEHFPRVDPVTITAIEHRGRLLLGRQPRFPPRRYSALAGFVEPGETVEECVAREVFEEAGVRVSSVSYVSSQPWPFPSTLMLACHAIAEDDRLEIDHSELEDAHWFTRAEIAEAMAARDRGEDGAAFSAPSHSAVANALLRWWLERN